MSDFRRKNLNGGRGVADLGIAAILTHYTIEPANSRDLRKNWDSNRSGSSNLVALGTVEYNQDYHGKLPHPDAAAPASVQYPTWECRFD